MNVLIIDPDFCGLDFGMRCQEADHSVRLWTPKSPVGDGLVQKVDNWRASMGWADLILLTANNKFEKELKPFFSQGYPILGANAEGAKLELDRAYGQKILNEHGIATKPNKVFDDYDKAISYVRSTNKPYVSKPWGGDMDKSVSFVSDTAADMIFMLEHWKATTKLDGQFMLQGLVEGTEIGVSGWFGPGGWNNWIEEDWEVKRLYPDDLGPNTGEQGTIMRYVRHSKLFDLMLKPLESFLHTINYVGNLNVNCIVDKKGVPWPLEFTARLGWPAFNIHQAVNSGDPVQWLRDLLDGKDTMKVSQDVVIGVVLSHGDYPNSKLTKREWSGFPIRGITLSNKPHLHFQEVMIGMAPIQVPGGVRSAETYLTAGDYILVATGTGKTVSEAQKACYETLWQLSIPSTQDRAFRNDIGNRLKKELPKLQKQGFAIGMEY